MASELFNRIINAYEEIANIRNMPDSVKDHIKTVKTSIDYCDGLHREECPQLSESDESLTEAKADEDKLIAFAGEDLANRFFALKKMSRLKAPYNDLYYWLKRDVEELEDFIDELESEKSATQQRKEEKQGAKVVYEDENGKVYEITTYDAAKYYGKGTKWCISGNYPGHEGRGQWYFNNYIEEQNLKNNAYYFAIENNGEKYALLIDKNNKVKSIWNAADDAIAKDVYYEDDIMDSELVKNFLITNNYVIKSPVIWNNSTKTLTFTENAKEITEEMVSPYYEEVEKVIIPDSVASIGNSAFRYCSNLTDVTIPDSVISIGNYAFDSCSKLTTVTISDSVTSIGDDAFYDCSSLTSVTIPDNVTSINDYTFAYCRSLTNITISDSVTSIGTGAFEFCSGLANIIIGAGAASIGDGAFYKCDNLTDVYYRGSKEQWNNIEIDDYNDDLLNAKIRFNNKNESLNEGGNNMDEINEMTLDQNGTASMLSNLVIDEWEAIEGYNSAIASLPEGDQFENIKKVLNDIVKEEYMHVGQLEAAIKEINDNADQINDGEIEGTMQLDESLFEDLYSYDRKRRIENFIDKNKFIVDYLRNK